MKSMIELLLSNLLRSIIVPAVSLRSVSKCFECRQVVMLSWFFYITCLQIFFQTCQTSSNNHKNAEKVLQHVIKSIKRSCGEVCDTSIEGVYKSIHFDEVNKNIDCPAMFNNPDFDEPLQSDKPLEKLPDWLIDEFTYGGKFDMKYDYSDESEGHGLHHHNWTKQYFEDGYKEHGFISMLYNINFSQGLLITSKPRT